MCGDASHALHVSNFVLGPRVLTVPLTMMSVALLGSAVAVGAAPLHFSNVFGSHMVLQRNAPVPVWGWSAAADVIHVTLLENTYTATADANGAWRVVLPPVAGSLTPYRVAAQSTQSGMTVALEDVVFGDVYFCSGQSNMEFTTNDANNATAEVAAANLFPYIRVTSGPEQQFFDLNTIVNQPYSELAITNLNWSVASNVSIGCPGCSGWNYYSAMCWFSIRDVFVTLGGDIPVGGIVQSYGGTSIQYWSGVDAINSCAPAPPGSACCNYGGFDSCLWDAQVFPYTLGPTQLSGVLWYQGEQNAGCGGVPQIDYYNCALPAMIADWRSKFQQPELVFGVVLLAAWQADTPYFPELRLASLAAAMTVPNVFPISALDRGDPAGGPVHSPFKQDVGARAAAGLSALVYGADTPYLGPRYASASVSVTAEVAMVEVTFTANTSAALTLNTSVACPTTIAASSCEAFAIQTADCIWHSNVTARLDATSTKLQLSLPTTTLVVASRGYFANWPVVQLYNVAGLPAEPWVANITNADNPCPLLPPNDVFPWSIEAFARVHA